MTHEAALITLAEFALPTALSDPASKLAYFQAVAAAFNGVCAERSRAAQEVVNSLLAAEKAQLEFAALIRNGGGK